VTDLKGKVAVVLGASAEGGTGWGIAEGLAEAGVKVVVAARSFEPLKKLADKIGGVAIPCDGGDDKQITALRDETLKRFGKIDIAVNSAATATLGLISEMTPALMQQAVQVNLFGMTYFVRDMAAVMKEGGSIILVSSMSVTHPIFPHFAYAAAKSGLECLVRYAAIEYGPRRIRINGLRIATVMSDFAKAYFNTPGVQERYNHEIPLGRIGQPEDMADAVKWLAGPAFITGSMLDVSGGHQLGRYPFLSELPDPSITYQDFGSLADREKNRS